MAPNVQKRDSLFCSWVCCGCYNTMKNKTLTKNMPYVKWNAIPPVKGPDSQGVTYGIIKRTLAFVKRIWVEINEIFNRIQGAVLFLILVVTLLD